MVQRDQALAQALLDDMQLGERQVAFVELAVEKALHEKIVNELAQVAGRGGVECPAGALDGIGEHDHADLPALRLRSGIAEV